MKRACILLLLAVSFSALATEFSRRSTPEEVSLSIRTEGADKVLSKLWGNSAVFEALLQHVDRGERPWFGVWLALHKHSDGAISESIDTAFARAIPRAPDAILRLIGHGLELNRVCTSPFFEPEPGVAEAYERSALRVLAQVKEQSLQAVATECAKRVRLN